MRITMLSVLVHTIAATNSGPICAILDPILGVIPGEICACEDSASGFGGNARCTMMVPSTEPIELVPAVKVPFTDKLLTAAVVMNPITFFVGTEVLPCGDPASVGVHAAITIPCGNFDASTFVPLMNGAIELAGGAAAGLSTALNSAGDLVISIEKTASASQPASVDLPMFVIPKLFTLNFRLQITVSGNLDSLTVLTAVDLCAAMLTGELCGSSIPQSIGQFLLDPPYEIFQMQAKSFTSSCSIDSPPPPSPSPSPAPSASSNTATAAPPPVEQIAASPPPPSMSDVEFTLALQGDVSDYTPNVLTEIKSAVATEAGVDTSDVQVSVKSGSVILDVSITVPTARASTVQSTMATATSAPSSATSMLASVTGVTITVTAVTTSPTVRVAGAGGSSGGLGGGAIAGVVLGALVAALLAIAIVVYCMKKKATSNVKIVSVA